jgi:hypothetical protein
MKEENEVMEEERSVMTYPNQLPAELIDEFIKDGEGHVMFVKAVDGGFKFGEDTYLKEIIGIITSAEKYYVKWTNGQPDKLYDVSADDVPDGYEVRCDIQILTDETLLGVSLAPSSYIYGFAQYLRSLKARNMDVGQVLTKLWVEQRHNKYGTFNVVRFALAGTLNEKGSLSYEDDEVPF